VNFDGLSRLVAEDNAVVGLRVDGRYDVLRRLGSGGMGDVFLANDLRLDRPVAMKVLARRAGGWSRRFRAEARVTTRLDHPGIVPVYDFGSLPDGRLYYTMKYVEGRTLDAAEPPRERVAELVARACDAVQAAHDRGVLHRDLKPMNVMVDAAGAVYVLDWGLAGAREDRTVFGTPGYMAPEQAERRGADRRSDVFGLGAILYHLLTGRPPRPIGLAPRKIDPSIPRELEAICLMALRHHRDQRYATARDLADDLRRYARGEGVSACPPGLARRAGRALRRSGAWIAGAALALLLPVWVGERAEHGQERALVASWSEILVAKQALYQAQRDPRETRERIRSALERIVGDDPRSRYVRARARMTLDDLEGATAELEKDPGFAAGWALLGRVRIERYRRSFWSQKYHKERFLRNAPLLALAEEAFRRAGTPQPWGLERMDEEAVAEKIARAMAVVYVEKDATRAWKMIEAAHAAAPSEEYANLLGFWAVAEEDRIRWQSEAIRIRPHYPAALVDRALARLAAKDAAGAVEDCTAAIGVNPGFAEAWAARAHAREGSKDYAGVIADATEALRLDPEHATSFGCRSFARWCRGERETALSDLTEALRLNPREPMLYYYRASSRLDLKDYAGAESDATQALALDDTLVGAYTARARAREELGRGQEAQEDRARALVLKK
jgi:serine/threonine protein kinase/tetratricopeptide (TPR) repeat protein